MTASIILVSPKGSGNVGSIARLMANFGLSDLRIVDPRCDFIDSEARMMAMKAKPILEGVRVFDSLAKAQEDLNQSYAFSMILGSSGRRVMSLPDFFETGPVEHFRNPGFSYAFVFGREEDGLTTEEIQLCDLQVFIPTEDEYPSMNLSQAVGICLYLHSLISKKETEASSVEFIPPRKEQEHVFFEGLEKALTELQFFISHNPEHVMGDLRNLYHRARVSDRELRILFGVVAQLEYRLKKKFFKKI